MNRTITFIKYRVHVHVISCKVTGFKMLMSIVLNVHPGVQLDTRVDSKKKFLLFGHGRDLAAFNGTGLQKKSFQGWAEISKA